MPPIATHDVYGKREITDEQVAIYTVSGDGWTITDDKPAPADATKPVNKKES